jgi:hypothetical protein
VPTVFTVSKISDRRFPPRDADLRFRHEVGHGQLDGFIFQQFHLSHSPVSAGIGTRTSPLRWSAVSNTLGCQKSVTAAEILTEGAGALGEAGAWDDGGEMSGFIMIGWVLKNSMCKRSGALHAASHANAQPTCRVASKNPG